MQENKHSHESNFREYLHDYELKQMKTKFESLDSQDVIDKIILTSKKNLDIQRTTFLAKDKYLEALKTNSKNDFVENMKNKTLKEIQQLFEKKIDDNINATKLYIEKKEQENVENKTILASTINKNEILEAEKIHLNREKDLLKEQLEEKQRTIGKLNTRFKIFEEYKPIFEEFFKEFPEGDPIQIIKGIKAQRETSIRIVEELDTYQIRIVELEREKKEIQRELKKQVETMSNRLTEMEREHQDRIESYLNEIRDLKVEVKALDHYKSENLKFHYMLFNLYNQLIERLKLDKNITIKKELLNVEEKDFMPDLFDNAEIVKYIKAMLISSSEEKSSKVLREVMAYANMMLRIYMKDNYKESKFDPVQAFKDIKKFIEDLQTQKHNSEHHMKRLDDKIKELTNENKKLVRELKYQKIKFENTEKKLFSQFEERVEKSKKIRNEQIMEKNKKRQSPVRFKENTGRREVVFNLENNLSNEIVLERPKTARNQQANKNKATFLTNDLNDFDKLISTAATDFNPILTEQSKNSRIETGKSRPKFSASTRPQTGFSKSKKIFFGQKNRSHFLKFELENKNKEEENESKKDNKEIIRNITSSKNRENLEIKGSFPHYEKNIYNEGLQNLVDHTNKLFLYKERVSKYSIKTDQGNANRYTRFFRKMDNSVKKINNATKPIIKLNIDEKISNDIDCMIKSLEIK